LRSFGRRASNPAIKLCSVNHGCGDQGYVQVGRLCLAGVAIARDDVQHLGEHVVADEAVASHGVDVELVGSTTGWLSGRSGKALHREEPCDLGRRGAGVDDRVGREPVRVARCRASWARSVCRCVTVIRCSGSLARKPMPGGIVVGSNVGCRARSSPGRVWGAGWAVRGDVRRCTAPYSRSWLRRARHPIAWSVPIGRIAGISADVDVA
jgi:hypothetical protein